MRRLDRGDEVPAEPSVRTTVEPTCGDADPAPPGDRRRSGADGSSVKPIHIRSAAAAVRSEHDREQGGERRLRCRIIGGIVAAGSVGLARRRRVSRRSVRAERHPGTSPWKFSRIASAMRSTTAVPFKRVHGLDARGRRGSAFRGGGPGSPSCWRSTPSRGSGSCAGNQSSTSYVFADAFDMSPAGSTTTRYGRPSSGTISSVFASRRSCSSHESSGSDERELLDLVELVHAEHAAGVASGGAGLAAEAGREADVAQGQLARRRGSRRRAARRAGSRPCRRGRGRSPATA